MMKLIIVLVIVVILFGPGRISKIMEDLGKGVKGFKDGLNGGENQASNTTITPTTTIVESTAETKKDA